MSRPLKKRFVCCTPKNDEFIPSECSVSEPIIMTVDEYETIRLIDLQDYTQEACAEQMHVSRTTVQSIYNDARKKLADALVNGKRLCISGGDYITCDCYGKHCGTGCRMHCHKHSCNSRENKE